VASKPLVLLALDSHEERAALARQLRDADMSCEFVTERHDFEQRLKSPSLATVILDVNFGGTSAVPLFESTSCLHNGLPVVFRARRSPAELELALQASTAGAKEILLAPHDETDLKRLVTRARDYHASTCRQGPSESFSPGRDAKTAPLSEWLVGESKALADIRSLILEVANTRATMLIHGESGTGKEQIATAVHRSSGRCDRPFVPVDLGAVPSGMSEQVLFSGVDAAATRNGSGEGKCEAANGGTLFLNEIGELDLSVQPQLLRFLETGEIERGGTAPPLELDVRMIVATTQEPRRLVNEGLLREDLFFRLHVVPLRVPPLRERIEDVEPLAQLFLRQAAAIHNRAVQRLSDQALDILRDCPWPGNVRQLRNAVERMVVFCQGHIVEPELVPDDIRRGVVPSPMGPRGKGNGANGTSNVTAMLTPLQRQERELIIDALRRTEDNVVQAAALLRMGQATVYRKIRLYEIAHTRRRRRGV
jgi:DNA-binding NtrC family response regulator